MFATPAVSERLAAFRNSLRRTSKIGSRAPSRRLPRGPRIFLGRVAVVCVWPNGLPPPPPLLCAAPPLGLSETSVEKIVAKQAALGWSAALCPITHCFGPELEMALNTEQEEKRLLREQVHNLEVRTHTHTHTYIFRSIILLLLLLTAIQSTGKIHEASLFAFLHVFFLIIQILLIICLF